MQHQKSGCSAPDAWEESSGPLNRQNSQRILNLLARNSKPTQVQPRTNLKNYSVGLTGLTGAVSTNDDFQD